MDQQKNNDKTLSMLYILSNILFVVSTETKIMRYLNPKNQPPLSPILMYSQYEIRPGQIYHGVKQKICLWTLYFLFYTLYTNTFVYSLFLNTFKFYVHRYTVSFNNFLPPGQWSSEYAELNQMYILKLRLVCAMDF